MIDVKSIREDFPILRSGIIYFDNSATTQKPLVVINALKEYYEKYNANVSRGIYELSAKATEIYENSRNTIANFVKSPYDSIFFVPNTTYGINIVSLLLEDFIKDGSSILLTEMEHHSNLLPWYRLAKRKNLKIIHAPLTEDYKIDLDFVYKSVKSEKVSVFSFTHISNVLGVINDVEEISEVVREVNEDVYIVVDGAQGFPHLEVVPEKWGIDFYIASGHKALGPMGSGFVYVSKRVKSKIKESVIPGGGTVKDVKGMEVEWQEFPWLMEGGTPDVASVYAFSKAVEYINNLGIKNIMSYDNILVRYFLQRLQEIEEVKLLGPKNPEGRVAIFTLYLEDIDGDEVAMLLGKKYNICVRSGKHCANPLFHKYHINNSFRASLYIYNTVEEIDVFFEALRVILEKLL